MSSIIGHGLSGIVCKRCIRTKLDRPKERALLFLSLFLAILPDFDVIVYIAFSPEQMTPHRGISHSLLFIALTALVFMFATYKFFQLPKGKLFLIYFCPLLAHLILDYLMGAGPPVPFFAPFLDRGFLCPVKLVPCAFYSTSIGGLLGLLFHTPTLMGFALELFIFGPLIIYLGIPDVEARPQTAKTSCLFVSILALLLTFYLYNH